MSKYIFFFITICLYHQVFSQQPVFVNNLDSNLYSVNVNNCTSRLIGNTNKAFPDIAFTSDGRLWGTSGLGLYQIDTANASITYIGASIGLQSTALDGLNDSTLLADAYDTLYRINVSNAQSYSIGYIGYQSCGDLSWYGNALYMTEASGLIIKIVLNSSYTTVISAVQLNNNPTICLSGLAVASLNGVDSLIGFGNDSSAYRIDTTDGTIQLLCSSLHEQKNFYNYNYGAASMTFPTTFPINLLNFSYTLLNKTVNLQWQTSTEVNSNYFLIERSPDGIKFSTIGKQAAVGNSNILKQYYFPDNNPLSTNYYRLKEVDLNGNATYSNTLLVKLPQATTLQILKNPVQNSLQVQVNSGQPKNGSLSIFDFLGKRLKTLSVTNGEQTIDVAALPSGVYILQLITNDGNLYNERFVKKN